MHITALNMWHEPDLPAPTKSRIGRSAFRACQKQDPPLLLKHTAARRGEGQAGRGWVRRIDVKVPLSRFCCVGLMTDAGQPRRSDNSGEQVAFGFGGGPPRAREW